MKLTLDISEEEFDSIVGADMEVTSTIFLDFSSDIRGVYESELINSVVNIYDLKDQVEQQGLQIEDGSLFVFGKMKIRIEGVKGADFKFVEGDFRTGCKQYHTWPHTLNKGDVVCMCGGNLSFLSGYYASAIIVAEAKHKITLTFDTDEAVPIDTFNSDSIKKAHSKAMEYKHTSSSGKLFNLNFIQDHLASGRRVIRSE
ncbi:hypothetical protein MH117_13450 [Paenibacillus sp. ACRRX]|uniref:hypothetical protein n=1 Tax=Paenibacillus sp. ACRRX TaxID=2918206 RepID=UPI001EF6225E|nr:hypothetical protein [Paenibacillus sp. ACRRX]MCG7408430.1 hypothetical protein [Paenibacillus sp. ACRRX]